MKIVIFNYYTYIYSFHGIYDAVITSIDPELQEKTAYSFFPYFQI